MNKNNKSFAKNAIFNVIYKIMNIIFPLITTIYISHVLMARGVGKVSTAQNIVQYFVLLAPMGIPVYGTREIAKIRDKKNKTDRLFTELFIINFFSTLCCSILYYCIILFVPYFSDERLLYIVTGLPIVFNFINVEWYYQGNENYVYIAVRSVAVKFLSLIAIFIFVRNKDDYIIYAFIYTLGIAGNYVFNLINLVKSEVRLNYNKLNFTRHLKAILVLLCSNIAIELYTLLDTTMLGIWCSAEIVGYYTNSIKLVRIVVTLIAAIGGVLLPRLSYYIEQGRLNDCNALISKVTQIIFLFAVPCGIGIFLLADNLVLLMFGETFMPAIYTIRIATILIYVLGFSNLFGTQVLLSFGQEKKLLLCTCVGAVSNIILNSILIPTYQHNGAVVASVISESLVTLLTIIFVHKYICLEISCKYYFQVIFSGIGMGVIVYVLKLLLNNKLISLMLSILVGAIVYFVINILVKNPIVIDARTVIKSKILVKKRQ